VSAFGQTAIHFVDSESEVKLTKWLALLRGFW